MGKEQLFADVPGSVLFFWYGFVSQAFTPKKITQNVLSVYGVRAVEIVCDSVKLNDKTKNLLRSYK